MHHPAFSPEIRDVLSLFLPAVGLWQVYWLISVQYDFSVNFYPLGLAVYILTYLAEFALLVVYMKIARKDSFSELGFKRANEWIRFVAVGFALAVFHNVVTFVVSSTFLGLEYGYILPFYLHLASYFALGLLVSFAEEGIFRGAILKQFLAKYGVITAIFVSSLLFGLYHIYYIPLILSKNPWNMIFQLSYALHTFTTGLFLAYFYYKTDKNIIGPIAYHFSLIFFNITYLPAETDITIQVASQQFSAMLNFIQILILKIWPKTAKPTK